MSDNPKSAGQVIPQLPDGCGYQGYEFGAAYPDSQCFGGRLYDMDNCDGDVIYEPGDYVPCPMCRPREAIEWHSGRFSGSRMERMKAARSLVADIRSNRKNGTEPWKVGQLARG